MINKCVENLFNFSKHTVFGHVIFGKEIVTKIENLETDEKSRPKVDVKIANCGELVLQVKSKGKLHNYSMFSSSFKKKTVNEQEKMYDC